MTSRIGVIYPRAFESKLAEIAARQEGATMEDVVERLRASKQKSDEERQQVGYARGRTWARKEAEAEELELARVVELLWNEPTPKGTKRL